MRDRRHREVTHLSYSAAHIPYQVPDAYLERITGVERSPRRRLLAMVAGPPRAAATSSW